MGTVCFLPASGSAAVTPTPSGTDWGHINGVSRPLLFAASGTARATVAYSPDAGDDLTDKNALFVQFVSDVLPPQTIPSQDIIFGADCSEVVATNNLFLAWKLYCVDVAGTSVLATISAIQRDGTEVVLTTLTGRIDGHNGVDAVTLSVPFRLVLEVGLGGTPSASGSVDGHNGSIRFGEDTANFSQDASTVSARPFLLFSSNLKLVDDATSLINSRGLVQ